MHPEIFLGTHLTFTYAFLHWGTQATVTSTYDVHLGCVCLINHSNGVYSYCNKNVMM
jgi:hypothetical protein